MTRMTKHEYLKRIVALLRLGALPIYRLTRINPLSVSSLCFRRTLFQVWSVLVPVFLLAYSGQAQFSSVQNGNWNDPATWNPGNVPTAYSGVSIGHNVYNAPAGAYLNNLSMFGDGTRSVSLTGGPLFTLSGGIGRYSTFGGSITVHDFGNFSLGAGHTNNGSITISPGCSALLSYD